MQNAPYAISKKNEITSALDSKWALKLMHVPFFRQNAPYTIW